MRRKLPDFPFVVAAVVLFALVIASALIVLLGFGERIILFLLLVFFASAVGALWCTFSRHWLTEYAVWSMYLAGFALMVLMVRSLLPKPQAAMKDEKPAGVDSDS
jgi:hypothetical protein